MIRIRFINVIAAREEIANNIHSDIILLMRKIEELNREDKENSKLIYEIKISDFYKILDNVSLIRMMMMFWIPAGKLLEYYRLYYPEKLKELIISVLFTQTAYECTNDKMSGKTIGGACAMHSLNPTYCEEMFNINIIKGSVENCKYWRKKKA